MKTILIAFLAFLLIPGFMSGCSKSEQPAQELPIQVQTVQQKTDVPAQTLVDDITTKAVEQTQLLSDETKSTVEQTAEAVKTKAAATETTDSATGQI
jgi:hypothetical protein